MVPRQAGRPATVAVYTRSNDLVPIRPGATAIATWSSNPAGPCHSTTAFTTITSNSWKNAVAGSKPSDSKKRVDASSK